MSARFFTFQCSLVALLVLSVGCAEPDREDYTGPAISLSSLEEAAKQIEEADRLSFPIVVDDAEWEFQPCTPTPPLSATNLSKAIPSKVDIWGLAVTTESGKALVTYLDKSIDRRSHKTAGAYCDLRSGRVLSTFDLPEFAAPFSIDPTGKFAILCRRDGIRYGRETLYIAELDRDEVLLDRWRPLVDPSIEKPKPYVDEAEIMWASFVGTDRIVTVNHAGTLHVWSFPERKRIGSFTGVDGMPTLTPDRTRVVFAACDTLALLDPSAPKVVGCRQIGPSPKESAIAVDPNGKRIAIGGKGEAMIIDLNAGGYFRIWAEQLSADPGMRLVSDFAWIGPFLHDTRRLYDLDSPRAVWSLDNTEWEMPLGDSYWAVVWHHSNGARFGSRELVLRQFKIPHQDIEKRIAQVYRTTDVLALGAGDSVRLDVSGIPADRRTEIRDALQNECAKKGFLPVNSAAVTIKAFLDPEKEFRLTYVKSEGLLPTLWTDNIPEERRRDVSYRGRHARLWITKHGRKLWSRNGMEEPPKWLKEYEVHENGKLSFYGEPEYSIFTEPNLPDFIAGDYSGVLGSTSFSADGLTSRTGKPKTRRRKK